MLVGYFNPFATPNKTLSSLKLFADVVRAVASMFRYMAAAVVDKDAKDFDSTYKEALSYMSFISKDKVYRNGGEVRESIATEY